MAPLATLFGVCGTLVALLAGFTDAQSGTAPGPVTVTTVVTDFTTYCPTSTMLTYNNKTYTVTKPTTLTITNCPCTLTWTKPATGQNSTIKSTTSLTTTLVVPGTGKIPGTGVVTPTSYPSGNVPVAPVGGSKTGSSGTTTAPISSFTGAAVQVAGSAVLALLGGAVAMAL